MGHKWYHSAEQHALLEYASLKSRCPDGIYISLKAGHSLQWHCTLFVRKGPYAPAILRFSITFPTNYPQSPPTLTFQTDIFHPLVTPLTTYTYTTGSHSNDTVSAGDDERLPPGSFSLGHGFPSWYGRKRDDRADMRRIPHSNHRSRDSPSVSPAFQEIDVDKGASFSMTAPGPPVSDAATASKRAQQISNREASIAEVLDYVKRSFDEEDFLDTLPLEAAGNPGAWKAWKSHRSSSTALAEGGSTTFTDSPEEWKWDGVWEQRVRRGIDASISDSVLFGTNQDDDGPHFLDIDDELLKEIKANILR